MNRTRLMWVLLACWVGGGCTPANPYLQSPARMTRLKERALEALKRGVRYEQPVVRAQAIESLQEEAPEAALAWIRTGLHDEHPAVRFAAAMALGTLRANASPSCSWTPTTASRRRPSSPCIASAIRLILRVWPGFCGTTLTRRCGGTQP